MHRASAVAAVLVTLMAVASGCGKGDGPSPSAAKSDLTISVTADAGATPVVMTLQCDPVGGNHPQAAEACRKIEQAGAQIFDPVLDDQSCTMIFGGPQTATVVGTYDGEPVDANFNRANGCEIDRWERLGTTVFDVPLR